MNLILVLAVLSGVIVDDFEIPPNIIYDSTTVSGIFVGFEVGDYVHPVIRDESGEKKSFWSTDPLLDYFLAIHLNERVILEIEEADSYIWEIADMMRIFRVIGARTVTVSFTHWRDSLEAEGDPADLLGDYFSAPYDCLLEIPPRIK